MELCTDARLLSFAFRQSGLFRFRIHPVRPIRRSVSQYCQLKAHVRSENQFDLFAFLALK